MHYGPPPGGPGGGQPPQQPPTGAGVYDHPAPQGGCGQGLFAPIDVEAKIGEVLCMIKVSDLIPFAYTTSNRGVDFEGSVMTMRLLLNSKHSAIGRDPGFQNYRRPFGPQPQVCRTFVMSLRFLRALP